MINLIRALLRIAAIIASAFLVSLPLMAQQKYVVSGYVRDAATDEELAGAVVYARELPSSGSSTNGYGFYSITLPAGKYTLIAQFTGYRPDSTVVTASGNNRHDFSLSGRTIELGEIVVRGERKDENIRKTVMGVEKMDLRTIQKVPVIFGERDILKSLQLTPGVKSAGEGSSGFFVRGGAADQNLVLLDEATVYNVSHLMGFFSVFNSDAIRDVTLYKGTQPAMFGGRLSSVLDVRMSEGNDKKFGVEGGIGLISSRLKVEGPLPHNKGSFVISGRRTYADMFLAFSGDTAIRKSILYFYDLNAKANYRINDKNRIFLSGYFGKDVLGLRERFGINWGNSTATLRWNHLFSNRLFSNLSLIFSNYDYKINASFNSNSLDIISRIRNLNLKYDFQLFNGDGSKTAFGFNTIVHNIIPGVVTTRSEASINELNLPHKNGWENAFYFSHEIKTGSRLSLEYGLRISSFSLVGPGDIYSYNNMGETIDTATYGRGTFIRTYINPEPRLSANLKTGSNSSVKFSYGRNTQNLHLLSNSTSGNPTDLWIPSSNNVKSEIADQAALGYFRNFKSNRWEFSAETYFKYLSNQIDYRDGAQLTLNSNAESQLLFGNGRAYGLELTLKRKEGRLTGWIGYTISRTEKKIAGINGGKYYPARHDRTHDFTVVAVYDLTKKWNLSASWIYYTGNAVSFPSGKYKVSGETVFYYTERNGYRMPASHRLDISATWQKNEGSSYGSSWNFSVYNVYGRENAYAINFRDDPADPTRTQAVQTTLFRWVPSVTYTFKF